MFRIWFEICFEVFAHNKNQEVATQLMCARCDSFVTYNEFWNAEWIQICWYWWNHQLHKASLDHDWFTWICINAVSVIIQRSSYSHICKPPLLANMTSSIIVALLWALPTLQTIFTVALNSELSHLVSNYESRRSSIQVSKLKLRCQSFRCPFDDSQCHIDSPNHVNYWT